MSKTDLATMSNLPATYVADDAAVLDELAKGAEFLQRLQLFQGGSQACNEGLIGPGEWGIPGNDDDILVLGKSIDLMFFARRAKALDISDRDAIVENFEFNSDTFQEIKRKSGDKDSGCLFGVAFLVFEASQETFLEFFCSSKSMRQEAKKMYPYLPRTQADVDAHTAHVLAKAAEEKGKKLTKEEEKAWVAQVPPARDARACTLTTRLIKKPTFSWHVPVVNDCSGGISKIPSVDVISAAITSFMSKQSTQAVTQEEAGDSEDDR